MALDTAQTIAGLRALTGKFDLGATTAEPFYPKICTIKRSVRSKEDYGFLGSMPGVREWVGDRIFNQLRGGHFEIVNRKWEDSIEIEKDRIDDDELGFYELPLQELGEEAAMHPDELVFSLIPAGETAACFDGQAFFDTDHLWGESGTQSNDLTYNATDHTAVTAAEFLAAFHAARAAMVGYTNDQGKKLNRPVIGKMNDLLVLVPSALRLVAETALTANLVGGGNTNIVLDRPQIVECAYLTSAVKFYVLNLRGSLKPFVFQARQPIKRQMKGLDDREFKEVKFMTDARYNAGYGCWWKAVLTTFT
jgi:phage major head subunit gpT-like protein